MIKLFRKNRCYNGGKLHNFHPRYSEKEVEKPINIWGYPADEIRRLSFYDVYEKDICIWCGKEIKK